jgi:hypothetical protein
MLDAVELNRDLALFDERVTERCESMCVRVNARRFLSAVVITRA